MLDWCEIPFWDKRLFWVWNKQRFVRLVCFSKIICNGTNTLFSFKLSWKSFCNTNYLLKTVLLSCFFVDILVNFLKFYHFILKNFVFKENSQSFIYSLFRCLSFCWKRCLSPKANNLCEESKYKRENWICNLQGEWYGYKSSSRGQGSNP